MVYLQQSERLAVARHQLPGRSALSGHEGHPGDGRKVMFVRIGLGECAIILLLLLVVIVIVALGIRQRAR